MQPAREFQLLIPPGGGAGLRISGATGIMPDVGLLQDRYHEFRRSALPDLSSITYTFGGEPSNEVARNFYDMGDYFIISQEFAEVFILRFLGSIEISQIRILHIDGSPVEKPYFALRVRTVVDCIDPELSTCKGSYPSHAQMTFKEGL